MLSENVLEVVRKYYKTYKPNEYIIEADNLYYSKEYLQSANKYKEAFDQLEGKASAYDRYNAACSYTLAEDGESAFYHLFQLSNSATKYKNYDRITTDPDLNILHNDKRWNELIAIVKSNKERWD